MKEKPDRKLSGQMMAMLVRFFSTVQALFKTHEIEPDFFDWIEGSGRELFEQKMGETIEVFKNRFVIDGDAKPFCPKGFSVESHRKMGQFDFKPSKIELWLSEKQKKEGEFGKGFRKEIEKLDGVMNANVLDRLLENTHLIPEYWKDGFVYFWGTIYRDVSGNLCVRRLYWVGHKWTSHYSLLAQVFYCNCPAARIRK